MNFRKPKLDFSYKNLTEFPEEVFSAPRVYKLNLSNNKIKEIPKEIAQLKYLETVDLSGNRIRHLKARLFDLPNLKILNLNNNEIVDIPTQIGNLKKVKILGFSNNKLTHIPRALATLDSLNELNLTGNKINSIPLSSETFKNLRVLWIADNPLANVESFQLELGMPRLRAIYCYSPKMEKVLKTDDRGIIAGAAVKGNCKREIRFGELAQDSDYGTFNLINATSINTTEQDKAPIPMKKLMPKIFISYCHKDIAFLERLQVHLKVLGHHADFTYWEDTRLITGDDWENKIKNALDDASHAVLLVSTDFLASDFIYNNELPPLLEAARNKGTRVLPVIVKPCDFFQHKDLARFQAVNDPKLTVSECSMPEQERVWLKLCLDIKKSFETR